jgi:BASS family bile acid:Na+ symporter
MNIITQVLLPLILAFIMFSMGLSLVPNDFKRITKFPRAFAIGFFLQVVSLPLLGFLIAWIWSTYFNLSPSYAVGLVIIAACPGGVTSNLMVHLGKGDTALSISLTAVISAITLFTLPFIVNLALETFNGLTNPVQLDIGKTVTGIFLITTVPVAIGMLVHYKFKVFSDLWEPRFRKMAAIFFIIIVLAAVAKDWSLLVSSFATIVPSTLVLNLTTMFIAILTAKMFSLSEPQKRAITFECGLQNGTLAIFVALTLLGNKDFMLPGAIYSLLMFISGGIYLLSLIGKGRKNPPR